MSFWLKRTLVTVFLLLLFVLFIRYQGIQTVIAYSGGGFAHPLPAANNYVNKNCPTSQLTVVSFNVMYGSEAMEAFANRFMDGHIDEQVPWSKRAVEIRARLASYAPDLIGLQEVQSSREVGSVVPLSDYSLVSYHNGDFEYADAALLYKTKRFSLLDQGQFWLSPTPDLPLSFGFKRLAVLRYVNWAVLRENETGFTFLFANTHFDNSMKNKVPSAELFNQRLTSKARDMPIIVTGDFNSSADTERYLRLINDDSKQPLLRNTYDLAKQPAASAELNPKYRIDHILVSGGACAVTTNKWQIDTRPLDNGQAMSDHDPVVAQLLFSTPHP